MGELIFVNFYICLHPLIMCKEGWCVRLGQEGGCLRERGGNCMKYFKSGWNRRKGSGNKDFKKRRGQAGSCNSVPSKHFLSIDLKYQ